MRPLDILARISDEKLEAMLGELNSSQLKTVVKAGGLSTRVPPSAVSPTARRRVLGRRIREGISRSHEPLASELIYQWLLHHRREMLIDYLDAVGVKHVRGETEETFTKTIPEGKLVNAALALRTKYDPVDVAVYVLYLDYHQEADAYSHEPRVLALFEQTGSQAAEA